MSRIPFLAGAALALGVALVVARRTAMRGFPDGHLTAFQSCLDPALALLPPAFGLCALALVLAAFLPRQRPAAVACAALPALAAPAYLLWTASVTCNGLENGWGG